MNIRIVFLLSLLCASTFSVYAQQSEAEYQAKKLKAAQNGTFGDSEWGRDSTRASSVKEVPYGQFQWTIDERLGTVIPAENRDTVIHNFQNWKLNDGYNGEYSHLGNSGSPRMSRIFAHCDENQSNMFLKPYSYFLQGLRNFRFTNTLSPFTNLAYHSAGDKTSGDERVYANFATNINKVSGVGFNLDYLYGRGYYMNSGNSQFGGTLYGYYRGDKYTMHTYFNGSHSKTAENGGVVNDMYIENPESFPRSYTSMDIPVNLQDTWNRNDNQTFQYSHQYNMGSYHEIEVPDSLKPKRPNESDMLLAISDSIRIVLHSDSVLRAHYLDSLYQKWENDQIVPTEYVPVASIIHTFSLNRTQHTFISKSDQSSYFTNHYYGNARDIWDHANEQSIRNTLGFAMREGFRKWVKMGITAFATYDMRRYELPFLQDGVPTMNTVAENDLKIGGEISKVNGRLLHYNVNGEFNIVGDNVGDFNVTAHGDLNLRFTKKDSIQIALSGIVRRDKPSFWMRHYHSQYTWWDNNDLDGIFRFRAQGEFSINRWGTKLIASFENVTNYTYFASQNTLKDSRKTGSIVPGDYTHDVVVKQGNVQVITATIQQNFRVGFMHWDNDITYQLSTDRDILPLPTVNIYTNLYALFRVAKVLRVQLGADMRFFTKYYAPDWSPQIGQYSIQDSNNERVEIGSYPIVNVYCNLHIKRFRFYVNATHVNAGHGRMYYAPHMPMNPLSINFGLSWNFAN